MPKDISNNIKNKAFGLTSQLSTLVSSTLDMANSATKAPIRFATALILTADQIKLLPKDTLKLMKDTGAYLKDIRQVAGITTQELAEALKLEDRTLLEAVESGTATLSFELILRISSLLARHDPIPFVLRVTRTYNPEVWQILHNWGIARIPLKIERERQFIGILRSRDEARQLTEEQFNEVLKATKATFDMGVNLLRETPKIDTAQSEEPSPEEPNKDK